MKRVAGLIAALCVMLSVAALAGTAERETLCQTSTINALLDGIYDGSVTYGALSERGDFGIGTFNGLDGEMIAFDGQIWQIKADGKAYDVEDTMHTPFAAMTFFDTDITAPVPAGTTMQQLGEMIDDLTPGPNLFYAMRVDGSFEYMKTRSVPGQQKPYPPLVEVTRNQPEFEFDNITGTIAGFRCPAFVKGINVPGDHLHFIDDARTRGGHILAFTVKEATVSIDTTPNFLLLLPEENSEFQSRDLTGDREEELHEAEAED